MHFFWGAMDLACTRFSGREAPEHPGGAPNCGDWVMVEGYSHELSSAGFWPGGGEEGAFYAYAYPEPDGFADHPVGPDAAYYSVENGQYLLPYEAVADSENPDRTWRSSCRPPTRPRPTSATGTGSAWRTTRTGGRSDSAVAPDDHRGGPGPPTAWTSGRQDAERVDQHADQATDDGAVDPDELQVATDVQLDAPCRLLAVPALDRRG